MDKTSLIEQIISQGPKSVDLNNTEHSKQIIKASDLLLSTKISLSEIDAIEKQLLEKNTGQLIFILLVLKTLKSKLLVQSLKQPIKVSIVFAVYKEHNRIKKNTEHPHGEDFLRRKVQEMEWLFGDTKNIKWELLVVDDGCPENSGAIAQSIIDEAKLNDKVSVLYLADAIEKKLPPCKGLNSTNDSQKGGAIAYGMWQIAQEKENPNDIIVFTDADLSTHLGQVGLLIDPLINQNKLVAIGSRREIDSVVIKEGARNDRGKLFIYLWKRLIPNLGDIIDTQCGFKAFKSELVSKIINHLIEKKFAFDIELLLKAELLQTDSITKVGIAWIDSEAASTTTDIQPYLAMLKSISAMSEKYFNPTNKSKALSVFIASLNDDEFNLLIDNIPEEILSKEASEFTTFESITASDLEKCINK